VTQIGGCLETVELLNVIFQVPAILNDGHEILTRLNAGDDLVQILVDLNPKFGRQENAPLVRAVSEGWPVLHREAVGRMVHWALEKLDTEDRVLIQWKGDASSPQTVTKFELSDHVLAIELAHPAGRLVA
jgi:hypothetical protein